MKTSHNQSNFRWISAGVSFARTLAMAVSLMLALGQAARAADGSWNVTGSGNWADAFNWTPGIPGVGNGTTNTDIATFGLPLAAASTVTVDANRNIGGITFSNNSTFGYTLSGGSLRLSNGGLIQSLAAGGAHSEIIVSAITIQGNGVNPSSLTVTSNSASASNRIQLNGGVAGAASVATTLTLNGSNINSNSTGTISNGGSGGTLAIIKDGTGEWNIASNNSFSGGVTLQQGTLGFAQAAGSFGTGTLTINRGTLQSRNVTAAAAFTNAIVVGGDFSVKDASSNSYSTTFSGTMDLGGATRTITANQVGSPSAFIFSGVISNGGLTKAGTDTLTLSGANTYTGDTTVSTGTLLLAGTSQTSFAIGANGTNNQILGGGTLTLDGSFSFDLTSAGTTLGNSWDIVHVATLTETFGGTFNVLGFTDLGGNLWEKVNAGTTYQFSETTGLLSVTAIPEPATWALLAFSLTTIMVLRRRRMA